MQNRKRKYRFMTEEEYYIHRTRVLLTFGYTEEEIICELHKDQTLVRYWIGVCERTENLLLV